MIRILDSRREEFRLSKAYEQKIDVVNVITAPEIEMLIIHAEGAYDQFKRSGKKPSEFCKTNLRMHDVKSYDFVKQSFSNPQLLGIIHRTMAMNAAFDWITLPSRMLSSQRNSRRNSKWFIVTAASYRQVYL